MIPAGDEPAPALAEGFGLMENAGKALTEPLRRGSLAPDGGFSPAVMPAKQRAILGTMGITPGALSDTPAARIGWPNAQSAPVLSLDGPSGFDAGVGRMATPSIPAGAALTLAPFAACDIVRLRAGG